MKAMASSKHGAQQVNRLFQKEISAAETAGVPLEKFEQLTQKLDAELVPRVVEVSEQAGYEVADLSVAEPSLETVFISLTGKELRD